MDGLGGLDCPGWPELDSRDPRFLPLSRARSVLVCLRALRTVKRAGGISEI